MVVVTTVASLVGTTQLATKGYGAADCNSCRDKAVYVPLRKLRDMNWGQAAGAWFVGESCYCYRCIIQKLIPLLVLGWILSVIFFAAA